MLQLKTFTAEEINLKLNDDNNQVLLRLNSTAIYERKDIVDSFKLIFNQLLAMGFLPRIINNCFRLHRFMSLAEAVNLLIKENDKYVHRFIEKEDNTSQICDLCEEPKGNHVEYFNQQAIDLRNLALRRIESKLIILQKKISREEERKAEVIEVFNRDEIALQPMKSVYMKSCEICLEEFDWANTEEKYKFDCGHPYCPTCLDFHLETEIVNGRVKKIICPYKNCQFEFIDTHIAVIIKKKNEALYSKYLKFKRNQELEDDPNAIFCPYPNCDGYASYENREDRVATPIKCQFDHEICTRCSQLWHAEKICEKQLDDEIQKLVIEHKMKLKRCPGCANWTEKNLGCNHMTCVFCKFQWCWLCNQKHFPTHYSTLGTKCYGKQFPQNDGQYEWEDYDPQAYEKARLGVNDQEPAVDPNNIVLPVNLYVPAVHVPRVLSTCNYFEELSPAYYKDEPSGCCRAFCNTIIDCFLVTLMAIFNFFGNIFMLIYLWKSESFIDANDVFRNVPFCKLMYHFSAFLLWNIYFVNIIGSSIVGCFLMMVNSCVQNCKHCCD